MIGMTLWMFFPEDFRENFLITCFEFANMTRSASAQPPRNLNSARMDWPDNQFAYEDSHPPRGQDTHCYVGILSCMRVELSYFIDSRTRFGWFHQTRKTRGALLASQSKSSRKRQSAYSYLAHHSSSCFYVSDRLGKASVWAS